MIMVQGIVSSHPITAVSEDSKNLEPPHSYSPFPTTTVRSYTGSLHKLRPVPQEEVQANPNTWGLNLEEIDASIPTADETSLQVA